jgi:hypothetical protein
MVALETFPNPGYGFRFPKGVVMDLTSKIAQINLHGLVTTTSQLGEKTEDGYLERAEVSGYMLSKHALDFNHKLNMSGLLAVSTKYTHYDNFPDVNRLRTEIGGKVPVTWEAGVMFSSVSLMWDHAESLPLIDQRFFASQRISEMVANGELYYVNVIDPMPGRHAETRNGLITRILKVLRSYKVDRDSQL